MNRCETFRRDLPPGYLRDLLLGLHEDYLSSAEHCFDTYQPPEAINALPFWRRAAVETRLKDTARAYPALKVVTEKDDSGFWNHAVVTAGDSMMTQTTVQYPGQLVRTSFARLAYAEPDNRRYLSVDFEPATEALKGFVYGILIHGREPREKFFPAFASIVFPKRNLDGYYPQCIDLFREFPETVRQCTTGIFEERHCDLERICESIEIPEPELRDDIGAAL